MKTILKKELKLKKDPGGETWSLDDSFFNVTCQHTNCIVISNQDSTRINGSQASTGNSMAIIWCRECGALKVGNTEFKLPESEK